MPVDVRLFRVSLAGCRVSDSLHVNFVTSLGGGEVGVRLSLGLNGLPF